MSAWPACGGDEVSLFHVRNDDRGILLGTTVKVADNPWTRLKGLLGRSELPAGQGLILRPCQGVHSFFMRFAIDVVYVDDLGRIITTVAPLVPGKMGPVVPSARWVLELPAGTLSSTGTQPGDRVTVLPAASGFGRCAPPR